MGADPDLDLAAKQALRRMINDLVMRSGMTPEDAYRLCSLAAELRVTQLVDGNKGYTSCFRGTLSQINSCMED